MAETVISSEAFFGLVDEHLTPAMAALAYQVVLRRRDARALSAEPALAAYAGQRVRVVGEQTGTTFVVDAITAEEPGEG